MTDKPGETKQALPTEGKTQVSLHDEALSPTSLKQYLDANRSKMDSNNNGFLSSDECSKWQQKFPLLSRDARITGALKENMGGIQALASDESWYQRYKGISVNDENAFDKLARSGKNNGVVKSVTDYFNARNYESVIARAQELREDRLHTVDLEMKKSNFSLDIGKHISNSMKAEYQTTVVGERQYDKYKVGEVLSDRSDWAGLLSGEIASYKVTVAAKNEYKSYSWVDNRGTDHPLSKPEFDALGAELQRHGKQLQTVPYSDATHRYVFDRPLTQADITHREPMQRYFLNVQVHNSSFTPSIIKQLRNATTQHKLEIEVPQSLYATTNRTWDPRLNTTSLVLGGRISQMKGDVTRKWQETDPNFDEVTTKDGRKLVIAKTK